MPEAPPPDIIDDSAIPSRSTWPTTVLLVIVAFALMLLNGFGALIQSASFFGDAPSRDDNLAAAMACLTTLPAFAALIWCGWQRGSRLGLWLIAGPVLAMSLVGVNLLVTIGNSRDAHPSRSPDLADAFGSLTLLNWAAVLVLVATAGATHLLRRRIRPAERTSAP